MLKLIIDRKEWLRGEEYNSYLLRSYDNKKCCLGFLSLTCGATEKDIKNKKSPHEINTIQWPLGLVIKFNDKFYPSAFLEYLMIINDSKDITDERREQILMEKFQKLDIDCCFTN